MPDQTSEVKPPKSTRHWIAAPWHTLTILGFFAWMVLKDAHHARDVVSIGATPGSTPEGVLLRGYFLSILFGVGMAYWCWAGVHWQGGTLRDLTGGRWTSLWESGNDVAIAIPFW